MITVKEFPNKSFADKGELFKALRENKDFLISQKKNAVKYADSVSFDPMVDSPLVADPSAVKELRKEGFDPSKISTLKMDLAINTSNLMDSHSDVHIPGLWGKSLKENKNLYLLQEHQMKFGNIIADDVKAHAKDMNWSDLGAPFEGKTQVLLFKVNAHKERNPFMFEQYAKGYVRNHSVGMRYIKLYLAMNSESKYDQEEKANWDKYIDQVANRELAEEKGYFWAVTEAKVIEGSAVPIGSNTITPTISTEAKEEAAEGTSDSDKGAGESHSDNNGKDEAGEADFYKNLI